MTTALGFIALAFIIALWIAVLVGGTLMLTMLVECDRLFDERNRDQRADEPSDRG